MEKQSYNEFSMRELFFFLKKRLWIVVVLAVVGALGGYIWGKTMVTPTYVSHSQIYVYSQEAEMEYGGLQVATQLRRDCEILISGRSVTQRVVDEMGLNMSADALSGRISAKSVENTRVLKVTYTDTNPQRAALILNTICEVAKDELQETMKLDVVHILYEATPGALTTQGARHYAMLGGLGGLLICLALLVVLFLVDDTIHNEEDVERYLELPTLAAIPASKELGDGTQRTTGKHLMGSLKSGKKR